MADQNSQRAPVRNNLKRLAFERTRNSYENTMMSWIRTSTSLITFGFSIYKFFQNRSTKPLTAESPHRTARVCAHAGEHRNLVPAPGDY